MNGSLAQTARDLVAPGKGILAADESFSTIKKRFRAVGIESSEENRRAFRELLFTSHDIEKYISGVILFDETIYQETENGIPFNKLIRDKGMILGIKVDQGKVSASFSPGESVTKGMKGLKERLSGYKNLGAKFSKWRAEFTISDNLPTRALIEKNARDLAEFAAVSQSEGFVPVVEPEVLMQGDHDIEKSREVSFMVLETVFLELEKHAVKYDSMLLKPSWVHPGFDNPGKPECRKIAQATLSLFKKILPGDLPGVVFLSGGESPEDATSHLNELNRVNEVPWQLSFSFGRALQSPALNIWRGKKENVSAAQKEFIKRSRLNSLARQGKYDPSQEDGL